MIGYYECVSCEREYYTGPAWEDEFFCPDCYAARYPTPAYKFTHYTVRFHDEFDRIFQSTYVLDTLQMQHVLNEGWLWRHAFERCVRDILKLAGEATNGVWTSSERQGNECR